MTPSSLIAYWPRRHSGGEYAWIVTLRSATPLTRWMCSGPNARDEPGPSSVWRGVPLIRGFCSQTAPSTTWYATEEMSWSCQPVSLTFVQHSSQTSTCSSRCSETKCRWSSS
jgi:hypothetical protein